MEFEIHNNFVASVQIGSSYAVLGRWKTCMTVLDFRDLRNVTVVDDNNVISFLSNLECGCAWSVGVTV